jgi:hypothetical protein
MRIAGFDRRQDSSYIIHGELIHETMNKNVAAAT